MTEAGAVPVPPDPERPFGLYVHFPYCSARCHYCAFYFVIGRDETRAAYLDAVRGEIEAAARDPRFAGRRVSTVYFGGGTPSLLAATDVDRLLAAIGRALRLDDAGQAHLLALAQPSASPVAAPQEAPTTSAVSDGASSRVIESPTTRPT